MLVATAGHVDHGKTSLVRRLTGVDTDRLAEEKRRGLTIELGYAFTDTTDGVSIGFIDVPGHARFINAMISGVGGIDLAMVVVAADDGPMAQTIEHVEILDALGVDRRIVVITKIDLVDEEQLNRVEDQISALLPNAAIYRVSNESGEGVEVLRAALEKIEETLTPQPQSGLFRMYIDRAFNVRGAGVVVTGTGLSGRVFVGDSLNLFAPGQTDPIQIRVREVHAQGGAATVGHVGQRCALNLAGKVTVDQSRRGSVLSGQIAARPSRRLDARCDFLLDQHGSLKHMGRVKVFLGTRRVSALVYFLGRERSEKEHSLNRVGATAFNSEVLPGQRVQLILDEDLLTYAGDRFVIRSEDEQVNLGGGIVLDPIAPQYRKNRPERRKQLDSLELGNPRAALNELVCKHGLAVSKDWFVRVWNLTDDAFNRLVSDLDQIAISRLSAKTGQVIVSEAVWFEYREILHNALQALQASSAFELGVDPESLRGMRTAIPGTLFDAVLHDLKYSGQIVFEGQQVRSAEKQLRSAPSLEDQCPELFDIFLMHGFQLPLRSELMTALDLTAADLEQRVRPFIRRKELLEVGDKRLALPATMFQIANRLREYFVRNSSISVIEAKDLFGLGRGITIEILEFLDALHFTRRRGDARVAFDLTAIQRIAH